MTSLTKRIRRTRKRGPRPRLLGGRCSARSSLRVATARIVGRGHELEGMPCQDAVHVSLAPSAVAMVLADGAGSAEHADVGATALVRAVADYLSAHFDELIQSNTNAIEDVLFDVMSTAIDETARLIGCAPKALSSTVLFVVSDGRGLMGGQLGDGCAGLRDRAGLWVPWLAPARGEHANETVFVTTEGARAAFKVDKRDVAEISGCVLMSDGAEAGLVRRHDSSFAAAVETMSGWVTLHPRSAVEVALEQNLRDVLRSKTRDDVSLGFMMFA